MKPGCSRNLLERSIPKPGAGRKLRLLLAHASGTGQPVPNDERIEAGRAGSFGPAGPLFNDYRNNWEFLLEFKVMINYHRIIKQSGS